MFNNAYSPSLSDSGHQPTSKIPGNKPQIVKKGRVLIVEDDRETLIWLAVLLRHAGYETVAAEDGAMAMTMAIKQRPDAIILDIGLPAGNGMFVLENIRRHIDVCMVPVVVLTGGDDFSEYELIGAGATYFFRKPTENEVLLNAIEAAVKI